MHCHHHCPKYSIRIRRKPYLQRDLLCFPILLKLFPF